MDFNNIIKDYQTYFAMISDTLICRDFGIKIRVNSLTYPEVWANANQIRVFSKLTNLVPKANLALKKVGKK